MLFDAIIPPISDTSVRPVVRLIEALRSPLPVGFEWDFRWAETCALGLGVRIGLRLSTIRAELGVGMLAFATEELDGVVPRYGVHAHDVTPAMVADALEKIGALNHQHCQPEGQGSQTK